MKDTNFLQEINKTVQSNSDLNLKFLTFFTEKQLFAIPIADVVQIVGMQNITEMPDFPNYVKGIINLRGSIIPVIDIRLRLGKIEKEYNERTCIIVTMIKDKGIGFIVDEVDAVIDIVEENISDSPKLANNNNNDYITGIARYEDKVVLLMDAVKIISDDSVMNFAK